MSALKALIPKLLRHIGRLAGLAYIMVELKITVKRLILKRLGRLTNDRKRLAAHEPSVKVGHLLHALEGIFSQHALVVRAFYRGGGNVVGRCIAVNIAFACIEGIGVLFGDSFGSPA